MSDSQTTLDAFDTDRLATDGGSTETDDEALDLDDHVDRENGAVSDAWVGAFIECSWGYNQTQAEIARIVRVSDSGKTVYARKVRCERVGEQQVYGSEEIRPTADEVGEEFGLRVRISGDDGEPYFRGSYPIGFGENVDAGSRLDSFYPFSNEEGATVRQTPTNQGH